MHPDDLRPTIRVCSTRRPPRYRVRTLDADGETFHTPIVVEDAHGFEDAALKRLARLTDKPEYADVVCLVERINGGGWPTTEPKLMRFRRAGYERIGAVRI